MDETFGWTEHSRFDYLLMVNVTIYHTKRLSFYRNPSATFQLPRKNDSTSPVWSRHTKDARHIVPEASCFPDGLSPATNKKTKQVCRNLQTLRSEATLSETLWQAIQPESPPRSSTIHTSIRTLVSFIVAVQLATAICSSPFVQAGELSQLPQLPNRPSPPSVDWLLDSSPFSAGLYRTIKGDEIVLDNGLLRRTFKLSPNAATIGYDNLVTGQTLIRGVKPEATLVIDGIPIEVGGLKGQPNYAYLLPEWIAKLEASPTGMKFVGFGSGPIEARMQWKRARHHAPGVAWPPKGVHLRMDYLLPESRSADTQNLRDILVSVHYAMYDGIPALSKWITVHNGGKRSITVNRFVSEILAAVEYSSYVEARRGAPLAPRPNIHIETDYSFGGMTYHNAGVKSVHWLPDPDYSSQVNYLRLNPCLLQVSPELGPEQVITPGGSFESFRTFELPYDSTDRERKSLALRRMYRITAPWVTENPLMMHMRSADPDAVRGAIDQCVETGFEMLILSFGSGFNIENESPEYLNQWKEIAEYANEKNVEIGGYSLLASRRIGNGNDVVMPEGKKPTFGNSPCIGSEWGEDYFRKLYQFFDKTGFQLLEHDGSYPGDECLSHDHPGHVGLADSRWNQWRTITNFYKWCREKGIYLNVPDFYYLAGSNKSGMGYREVNWSLPRAQQVIHTRQNIYDGTWGKTPSMGWMFVPLTQYHGGGAAATIEPLQEHMHHYAQMMRSNLGLGVQACYRGPRLYDSPRTKQMVREQVQWFKTYRDILESDVIHGRRADGRDLDWMLHVNPNLEYKGMLVVYNPLNEPVAKHIHLDLYYTGLDKQAIVSHEGNAGVEYQLDRRYAVELPVHLEAQSMTWFLIQ